MNKLVREILAAGKVRLNNGKVIDLHSAIGIDEAEFISNIITKNKLNAAVEVGCAMGLSSLVIAEALTATGGQMHYILDPNQSTQWENIGVNNLRQEDFTNFELIEEGSETGLPKLLQKGVRVNFGFIDGWHTFDHTLLDFFYINRMLDVGGIVVIDDVHMPAVSKVARYIFNYPCYEFAGSVKNTKLTAGRKIYEYAARIMATPRLLMGRKISEEFFNSKVIRPDSNLHLDCTMIAFRKVAEDDRPWNWHKNF